MCQLHTATSANEQECTASSACACTLPPVDVEQQLLDRLLDHKPTPHHRRVRLVLAVLGPRKKEAHAHACKPVAREWNERARCSMHLSMELEY
jgi:hypothetical protein